jgi:hypothetical protein
MFLAFSSKSPFSRIQVLLVEILQLRSWIRHTTKYHSVDSSVLKIASASCRLFKFILISPFVILAFSDAGGGNAPGGQDDRRKRQQPAKRKNPRDEGSDGRNARKTSLRIGTGKKARAASLRTRRGSLRKMDRAGEKEAKEEAAQYRRTVFLPEYVFVVCIRLVFTPAVRSTNITFFNNDVGDQSQLVSSPK